METRCNQTSLDRSKKIRELKELMASYFQREDNVIIILYRIVNKSTNMHQLISNKRFKGQQSS